MESPKLLPLTDAKDLYNQAKELLDIKAVKRAIRRQKYALEYIEKNVKKSIKEGEEYYYIHLGLSERLYYKKEYIDLDDLIHAANEFEKLGYIVVIKRGLTNTINISGWVSNNSHK